MRYEHHVPDQILFIHNCDSWEVVLNPFFVSSLISIHSFPLSTLVPQQRLKCDSDATKLLYYIKN